MRPPDDSITLIVLAIIGPLSGVLVGYWLSNASVAKAARLVHRKRLREIKSDIKNRQWEVVECRDQAKAWWITAVEDYQGFRRWRIDRLIFDLANTPFPDLSENRHVESDYTADEQKQDQESTRKFVAAIDTSITKILRWA